MPCARALTLVFVPSSGELVNIFESLADQIKRTPVTSVSTPSLRVKARALKTSWSPMSSVAAAGVTSTRASPGEPKGVPLARSPGE